MKKKYYIIVKKDPEAPTVIRYGLNGGGKVGYCLKRGQIVCFETFWDANNVINTFDDPHLYDIVDLSVEK